MFVKNDHGDMVPYSAFMQVKKKQGLEEITRYDQPILTSRGRRLPASVGIVRIQATAKSPKIYAATT